MSAAARPTRLIGKPVEVPLPPARAAHPGPDSAGVFVTPRLLNQAAFDEMAGQLRELVDLAQAATGPLKDAAAGAERTLAQLQAAAAERQTRFEQAETLLRTLDERVRSVEAMLVRATDSAAAVRKFEEQTDEAIRAKAAAFEQRLEAMLAGAAARAAEIECRAAVAADTVGARTKTAAELLEAEASRAEQLLVGTAGGRPGLADLVRRAEGLGGAVGEASAQLASLREQIEQAKGVLGESLVATHEETSRLAGEHERLRVALAETIALCRAAQGVMDSRSEELRAALEPPFEDLQRRADATTAQLRAAAMDAAPLRALLERLEPWRGVLLSERAGKLPEPIVQVIQETRRELAAVVARVAGVVEGMAGNSTTRA